MSHCGICNRKHATEKCWNLTRVSVSERFGKLRNAGLCYVCFKPNHVSKQCNHACSKCKGKHHPLLCNDKEMSKSHGAQANFQRVDFDKQPQRHGESQTSMTQTPEVSQTDNTVTHVGISHSENKYCTALQTATVLVKGRKCDAEATVMFDSGSDNTYVSSNLIKRVGSEWVASVPMSFASFGDKTPTCCKTHNVYNLTLQGLNGNVQTLRAVEVKTICPPMHRPKIPVSLVQSFGNIRLADEYDRQGELNVDILIGLDSYWKFVKSGVIKSSDSVVAQETVFGWIISGAWQGKCSQVTSVSPRLLCLSDSSDSILRNFWYLETIGICPVKSDVCDTVPVLKHFNDNIKMVEGRYEVKLPWKERPGSS